MIKRLQVYELPAIEAEEMEWVEWAFHSHNWVEGPAGFYECKFCGKKHTSTTPIMRGYPLCPGNPYIKNYVAGLSVGGKHGN